MYFDRLRGLGQDAVEDARRQANRYGSKARSRAEDYYDDASDAAQQRYEQARDYALDLAGTGVKRLSHQVEDQPLASLLLAAAAGFVIGWAVRR